MPAAAAPALAARPTSGGWGRFALRRLRRLVVSLWVLVTAAFAMIHLVPGDPVRAALGLTAKPELVASVRASLGLDDPLWLQYWHYLTGVLAGDFGTSITTRMPVADTIGARLGATLALAVLAFLVSILVAIPLGAWAAVATHRGRGKGLELGFAGTSVVLAAIPDFLIGVILVWLFAVTLKWLPVAGIGGPANYVLPVLALAIGPAAILARIVRVEMLTVLGTDYVRTARAKRLSPWRINLAHALPNAVTASLTIGGLLLGSMIAGTVLVENVFAWPGLGAEIVSSILLKDYPLVQGIVLMYGTGVLLLNTLVDVALAALNPQSTITEG
ncbi:MAG: ABC transporter permease [Propionibacteriaceae bacterium]|jgi:peptide/nickel transport system permease protein|nr:ABC transporter permease [Propionibacteriaceae bacterium]